MSDVAGRLRDTLTRHIATSIRAHPRSQQQAIGPSEIGNPCARALIHKLAGTPDPRAGEAAWRPAVGTAIHSQLDAWFRPLERYIVETRVHIGHHAGQDIGGHMDLFDLEEAAVIDWKTASATRLKSYRANGPSPTYRVQAHLYGLGAFRTLGIAPRTVALAWLPRDGDLRDAHVWAEPWDPMLAVESLTRLDGLYDEVTRHGLTAALNLHPTCGDAWCGWCKADTRPTTTAEAIATALTR